MWKKLFRSLFGKAPGIRKYQLESLYRDLGGYYPLGEEHNFIRALTHASMSGRPGSNFEQLEFLGDAILSAVIAEALCKRYPKKREGDLSKLRSWVVSRRQLNEVADRIGLSAHIRHSIDQKKLAEARHMGGDVLEALLGAYYLDSGIETVRAIAEHWIITDELMAEAERGVIDPKSFIHEWAQRRRKQLEFVQVSKSGEDIFEVELRVNDQKVARGKGRNKKDAERAAAELAMKALNLIR